MATERTPIKVWCNGKLGIQVGVRYIVTHASRNLEFQVGDHIVLNADGSIDCREAHGWMEAENVPEATRGMTVAIDEAWAARPSREDRRRLTSSKA